MLNRTLKGSGLTLAGLGALARQTAPRVWDHYSRDRARRILPAPFRPAPSTWSDTGLHAAWLGHSTVLLKIDGVTVLTDPVFSRRVGLNFGPVTFGLKRLVSPALRIRELPRVDLVLLSHAHMDHFDLPSLRALQSRDLRVITASKTSDLLDVSRYGAVDELRWGQELRIGEITVRAFEVNHWGARMRSDTYRGYNGYTVETPNRRILFGGDTALTNSFSSLRSGRPFHLAIMPIGAYNPWIHAHCTPEQALRMADDAGSEFILPVHHRTFELSREPLNEPIERLLGALGGAPERLALQDIGQEFQL